MVSVAFVWRSHEPANYRESNHVSETPTCNPCRFRVAALWKPSFPPDLLPAVIHVMKGDGNQASLHPEKGKLRSFLVRTVHTNVASVPHHPNSRGGFRLSDLPELRSNGDLPYIIQSP